MMVPERTDTGHNDDAKSVWNVSLFQKAETVDQLVRLPWRAVVLRPFEEECKLLRR